MDKREEPSSLERALMERLNRSELKNWIRDYSMPYKELMAYYRCALMEVETKFNVLNEELSLRYDRNPIETVKSRLKSPEMLPYAYSTDRTRSKMVCLSFYFE